MSTDRHLHTRRGRHTKVWRAWSGMKNRCLNPRNKRYPYYGGRGITVCARWRASFEAFLEDVGEPPSPKHTLGRIDNDANYEPGNVRWELQSDQNRNTRATKLLTFEGRTLPMAVWARERGLKVSTLHARITVRGWPVERALTEPLHPR